MPILRKVPPAEELAQGDLLTIEFERCVLGKGKPPRHVNGVFKGLVVSRDCVAANKAVLLIAPVTATTQSPFESIKDPEGNPVDFFSNALGVVTKLRDGAFQPDRFYLGHLPDQQERLVAHLDELTPFDLPFDRAEVDAFVAAHRIGRLTDDFTKHLCIRIYSSLTRVGFDDYEWFCDGDLEVLVVAGRSAISEMDANIGEIDKERALRSVTPKAAAEKGQVTVDYDKLKQRRDKFKQELASYDSELQKRLTVAGVASFLPPAPTKQKKANLVPVGDVKAADAPKIKDATAMAAAEEKAISASADEPSE